uniref:Regulator of nonsense transcripts 2 n=1 Tax=Hemiscolopendra marginata TaxID=943146 RepID=A0A646QJ82_9MYRI
MSSNLCETNLGKGDAEMIFKDANAEKKGKSWKREREERGRRQQQQIQNQMEGWSTIITKESCVENQNEVPCPAKENNPIGDGAFEMTEEVPSGTKESSPSVETINTEDDEIVLKGAEEEEQNVEEEERKCLEVYMFEAQERLAAKAEARLTNQQATNNRPEESFFSKLDSSLKKNTAFIKRLKNFTEAQKESLIRDMSTLNLTKYIGEAAAAIVEAKLKMTDVNCGVQICSLLHQRYAEFSPMLLEHWQKVLSFKKDEKIGNPSKLRVDLRFYAELVSSRVFTHKEGLPLLGNLLTVLTTSDKEEHNNLNIILSFCKHCGEDYAGLIPRKIRLLTEQFGVDIPRSEVLTIERQKNVRMLLRDYFQSLCKHLIKDHKEIQTMERQNRKILHTKGELNNERKEKYEAALTAYQKLLNNTQQFADIIDEDMPDLPQDDANKQESEMGTLDIHNRFKNNEFQFDVDTSLWEDEDTRSFYENLPDLKSFIPGILFKDSVQSISSDILQDKMLEEDMDDIESPDADSDKKLDENDHGKKEVSPEVEDVLPPEIEDVEDEPENTSNAANKILLESFLNNIQNCINRELIDKAAIDFCMNLNTKPNRRKLVKTLFLVPRTRLDLLPFYARLVATLHPCMPDVATDLASTLKQDLKYHVRKKDQINIESKVKIVRFIGELVKFKMFPKADALQCLKLLLFDFTHHHIEMACNLLETCGRFLFRSSDSHHRTKYFLEQMMRKKTVLALDSRYVTMIENAYYYCNPPEAPQSVKKDRPPMHEYIRRLLYKDLSKNNTEKILRQMRKLNWDDADTAFYATKCLTAIWNVKYYNIRCVANLLAGLVAHQVYRGLPMDGTENVGPQVVDGILEDIRLGMEINHPKYNQRRVSAVRYLGELYNYRMVESAVIFKTLYSFITFGVNIDGYSELDPPDHLFRLRLTCILLDTCGQYFNSGSSKKKLDCFLTYFQRYYWQKKSCDVWNEENSFPVTMDFMLKDTVTALRPKLKLFESVEEAQKAIEDLEKEIMIKLMEIIPSLKLKDQDNLPTDTQDGLETIKETDEGQQSSILLDDDHGDDDDHSMEESITEADGEGEDDVEMTGESQSQPMDPDYQENDLEGDYPLDSEGDNETGDNVKVLSGGPKHMQCQEDEDFMTAFDRMLSENIQHRSQEAVKPPKVDISVPMHIKGNSNKKVQELPRVEEHTTVNFVLMTRKGNKQQYKNLEVPVTSELAQNLRDKEEAERAEKERVKKLVLDISERQEEEDYQEMLATQQRPAVMNPNRERRQKYQHPKGAPDADLIFGNKKR